jgi:hypothetical protein
LSELPDAVRGLSVAEAPDPELLLEEDEDEVAELPDPLVEADVSPGVIGPD